MNTQTITGTYGSNETETHIFTCTDDNGLTWYVCEDSVNINATWEDVEDGVNVEELTDSDVMTASNPVLSEDVLLGYVAGQWIEENFDDATFCTSSMIVDFNNGNFNLDDDAAEYEKENIIKTSIINGQISQAKAQCSEYGFDFDLVRSELPS